MKTFQTQFLPGASLGGVATNPPQAAQFTGFLATCSQQGWTCDHIFEVNGGLLFVLSKPSAS